MYLGPCNKSSCIFLIGSIDSYIGKQMRLAIHACALLFSLTSLSSLSDPKLATKRQTVTAMLGIDKKAHKPTASILIFTRTGICLASDSDGILIIHHVLFTRKSLRTAFSRTGFP